MRIPVTGRPSKGAKRLRSACARATAGSSRQAAAQTNARRRRRRIPHTAPRSPSGAGTQCDLGPMSAAEAAVGRRSNGRGGRRRGRPPCMKPFLSSASRRPPCPEPACSSAVACAAAAGQRSRRGPVRPLAHATPRAAATPRAEIEVAAGSANVSGYGSNDIHCGGGGRARSEVERVELPRVASSAWPSGRRSVRDRSTSPEIGDERPRRSQGLRTGSTSCGRHLRGERRGHPGPPVPRAPEKERRRRRSRWCCAPYGQTCQPANRSWSRTYEPAPRRHGHDQPGPLLHLTRASCSEARSEMTVSVPRHAPPRTDRPPSRAGRAPRSAALHGAARGRGPRPRR